MEKALVDFVTQKTNELLAVEWCCEELKVEANNWLAAVGTANEHEATVKYLQELSEDVMTVDQLAELVETGKLPAEFGAHVAELKAAGALYCDCDACAPGAEILAKKDELLK